MHVPALVNAKPGLHTQLPATQAPATLDISALALHVWSMPTVQVVGVDEARQRPLAGLSSKPAEQVQVPVTEHVPATPPTPPSTGPSLHDMATPGVQLAPALEHDQPCAVHVQPGRRPEHAHCVEGIVPCGQTQVLP